MNQILLSSPNSMLQTFNAILVLIPVAIILIKQKGRNRYFLSFAAANLMFFISTLLLDKYIQLPEKTSMLISTISNVLQAPFTLIFLLYFSESRNMSRAIHISLAIILAVSASVVGFSSYSLQLLLNLIALGSLPVFIFSSIFFIQFVQLSVHEKKGTNKAFMLSTIVFTSGTFMLLILLNMIYPEKHATDIQSLFGLITIISTAFVSISISIFDLNKKEKNTVVVKRSNPRNAGFAQWEDFNFLNSPDISKTTVSNMNKYYNSYQETN